MEKDYCILQYFQEKNYKDNFRKKIKKKQKEKNHVEKRCSNLQCFVRKYIIVILNQLNIKKIKLTKIVLKKFITKKPYGE